MKLTAYHPTYRKLQRLAAKENEAAQLKRYQVVMAVARRLSKSQTALLVGMARSSVNRIVALFESNGVSGLCDKRSERSPTKVTEKFMGKLEELIWETPRKAGWQRSTWTRELLAKQLEQDTGVRVHASHIGRLLRQLGIRWGRARPTAKRCFNRRQKSARMRNINALLRQTSPDEVVLYQDEVDVHLNPKIGPAWMPRGAQMEIETPGKNQKRYVFGGLNAVTGQVTYTESNRKTASEFVNWLKVVAKRYAYAGCIHVICDNYVIHKTASVKAVLATLKRVTLHFLPPYSPEFNRIELLWKQLHAHVTRNHQCKGMDELMEQVRSFLDPMRRYGWRAQRKHVV